MSTKQSSGSNSSSSSSSSGGGVSHAVYEAKNNHGMGVLPPCVNGFGKGVEGNGGGNKKAGSNR